MVEDLAIIYICEGWSVELVFTGTLFKLVIILIDCAMEGSAKWLRTTVLKLPSWKRAELSTYIGDDTPEVHMLTVYHTLSKPQQLRRGSL